MGVQIRSDNHRCGVCRQGRSWTATNKNQTKFACDTCGASQDKMRADLGASLLPLTVLVCSGYVIYEMILRAVAQ